MRPFFISVILICFHSISQATVLNSPIESMNLTQETKIEVGYTLSSVLAADVRFVVFRRDGGQWSRVHQVAPIDRTTLNRELKQDITPKNYVCQDTYAIRLMRGTRTLAGPVHFTAGVGACSGSAQEFVNLEKNLSDIVAFEADNQLDRDTCGAFATVAALEAAYFRLDGRRVRLSQHYNHHIVKSSWLTDSVQFKYENQSSYFGGNDVLTSLKFIKDYPLPESRFSPYQSQAQLTALASNLGIADLRWRADPRLNPVTQSQIDSFEYSTSNISHQARAAAIYGATQTTSHGGAQARNAQTIENYLRQGKEVIVGMSLFWRDHPTQIKTKIPNNQTLGGHMMLIVGFDKTNSRDPHFLIKNSWGEGIIRVSYPTVLQNTTHIGVIDDVWNPDWGSRAHWVGQWDMQHDNWHGRLTIRRTHETNLNHNPRFPRLGHYRENHSGAVRCVWGNTTNGYARMIYFIDFESNVEIRRMNMTFNNQAITTLAQTVCPQSPPSRAQRFEVDLPTRSSLQGTGTTWWNGRPFPVSIRK